MKTFKEEFAKIKQLCESDEYRGETNQILWQLKNSPIVLYGAGAVGVDVYNLFKYYGLNVACFCDKNKSGVQKDSGLPIISPQVLLEDYKDTIIVISTIYYADEIKNDLAVLGIPAERIISGMFFNLNGMTLGELEPHLYGYERAYNLFSDSKSKEIVLGRLKCFLTFSPLIPAHITPLAGSSLTSQYFDSDILTLSHHEVFVDGGMYIGDTAEIFFRLVKDNYEHYYGFEPDYRNCIEASRYLSKKPNVTIIANGLWNCEGQLKFNADLTSSSKLDEISGSSFVDVTALDIYFADKTPPTFIKMDIEGAEFEALKGAENIIRNYKPKLAICAYHKPEDIYTLPELIKSYRDDYKFYLRHYTNSMNETVLYAL